MPANSDSAPHIFFVWNLLTSLISIQLKIFNFIDQFLWVWRQRRRRRPKAVFYLLLPNCVQSKVKNSEMHIETDRWKKKIRNEQTNCMWKITSAAFQLKVLFTSSIFIAVLLYFDLKLVAPINTHTHTFEPPSPTSSTTFQQGNVLRLR